MDRDLESIETAAHIEHFAGGYEMAGPEFKFLPAGPEGYALVRIGGSGEVGESLMDFESVLVGETRTSDTPVLDSALKLREESDMPAGVRIGMQQVALQQEAVGRIRNAPKGRIAEKIPANARLPPDGKIRIGRGLPERNELPRIPGIAVAGGIFQRAPVFVKALIQIGRPGRSLAWEQAR